MDLINLTVVCVNMNGLRKKKQRTLLGKLMFDLWAGVCIVTESHLRKPDLDKLAYSSYFMVADYCRPIPLGEKIGGGVVIIVHETVNAESIPEMEGLAPQVEHCAIKLYLTNQGANSVNLSGIYIPPYGVRSGKRDRLERIVDTMAAGQAREAPSHILAGDFNVTLLT